MNQYFKGEDEKISEIRISESCHSERSEEPMHSLAASAVTASAQILRPAKSAGLRMTGLAQQAGLRPADSRGRLSPHKPEFSSKPARRRTSAATSVLRGL